MNDNDDQLQAKLLGFLGEAESPWQTFSPPRSDKYTEKNREMQKTSYTCNDSSTGRRLCAEQAPSVPDGHAGEVHDRSSEPGAEPVPLQRPAAHRQGTLLLPLQAQRPGNHALATHAL